MLANRAVARPGVDVGTVHLGSPEQVSRLVLGRGGLRPDPELRGEFERLPLRFKHRRGIALDELAQEVADAQGLSARRVQDEILRALERTGRARPPARAIERVPAGVPVPLEEWRAMSSRAREATVGFFRAGQVMPETGREHRPRVRVEGHRFLLRLHSPWKGFVTEVNPMTFSQALRAAIRQGVRPATAMREAWRQVRAGQVSPPPRQSRRSRSPGARLMARGPSPRGENPLTDPGEIGGFVESRRRAIQGLNFADDAISGMTAAAIGRNPMSHEDHVRLSSWAQFGPRHFITRVGRRWIAEGLGSGQPSFPSRKAAERYVDAFILERSRRARGAANPYYHPGLMDLTDPNVIRGRPIRPGAFVRVTRGGRGQPKVDPLGRIVWVEDDEGNEQSVWKKALHSQKNPAKGERLRPELKEARRLIRLAAHTGGTVPFDLRTLIESGVSLDTIRKVYRGKNPPAGFCPERLEDPRRFDQRSFRTVTMRRHRVTVGCPTGQYDARHRRCKVGTRAQRVLHPEGERGACPIGGTEVNPKGRGPIRYSQLTEEQRAALVQAYTQARAYTADALHAAAIAAREVLIRSDREWNTPRGSDAFGAAVGVLAFRRAMKVNPLTRSEAGEILTAAREIYRGARRLPELTAPEYREPRARVAARAYRYGEGDAFLRVARTFGPARRGARRRETLGRPPRSLYRRPHRGFRAALKGAYPANPAGAVKIYDTLLEIRAQKGRGPFQGQRFFHRFNTPAAIYGLPDGRLLIAPRGRGQ